MKGRATGLALRVNGKPVRFAGPPFTRLIDVLREDLGLTGTKEGCGEGECGACTVLLDGRPVNSCLIPVCQAEGRRVETVESLGTPSSSTSLQQAFLTQGGAQCGICTPGMLMTAWATCAAAARATRPRSAASWPGTCAAAPAISTSSTP